MFCTSKKIFVGGSGRAQINYSRQVVVDRSLGRSVGRSGSSVDDRLAVWERLRNKNAHRRRRRRRYRRRHYQRSNGRLSHPLCYYTEPKGATSPNLGLSAGQSVGDAARQKL